MQELAQAAMNWLHQLMQQQLLLPLHTLDSTPDIAVFAAAAAAGTAAASCATRTCVCLLLVLWLGVRLLHSSQQLVCDVES